MHATSWPACMAHYRRRSTSSRKSTKQLNLKVILELPTSTPSAALFMETEAGICPATERIQYLTSMLYQNMMKRSGSIAATIVQAQQKSKTKNTMPDRMTAVIEYTKKTSEEIKEMQKSDWKKIVKKALDKKVKMKD